jgi:hypothetical protein
MWIRQGRNGLLSPCTRSDRIVRFWRVTASALTACLAVGCATTSHPDRDLLPAPTAMAMTQPWSLTVGLYVPADVRNMEVHQGFAHAAVGGEIASTFQWALTQLFTTVVLLDAPVADPSAAASLAGIIELSHVGRRLDYDVTFRNASGEVIGRWSMNDGTRAEFSEFPIPEPWDVTRSDFEWQGLATGAAYTIRDNTALLLLQLPRQEAVRSWLADAHVQSSTLHPYLGQPRPGSGRQDRVVLLPNLGTWYYTNNGKAMSCAGERLRHGDPPIEVINIDDVRLAFFPWLEPSTAPKTPEELHALLEDPAIQQKMAELGIRYLMAIEGGTTQEEHGGMWCGVGPTGGGGGCLGFVWGNRESSYVATIVDVTRPHESRDIAGKHAGHYYVPAFALPIPLIAPTQGKACEQLAEHVRQFFLEGTRAHEQ